jgi:hypothetical protein
MLPSCFVRASKRKWRKTMAREQGALKDREQGRRQPERAVRILLKVIENEPKAIERAPGAA